MLRAYNRKPTTGSASRAGNVVAAKKRLETSGTAIAKLGRLMEMRISDEYHDLRVRRSRTHR